MGYMDSSLAQPGSRWVAGVTAGPPEEVQLGVAWAGGSAAVGHGDSLGRGSPRGGLVMGSMVNWWFDINEWRLTMVCRAKERLTSTVGSG